MIRAVRAARSGAEALQATLSYVLIVGKDEPERVHLALAPAGPDSQQTLMNTAEQLMARGRIQGVALRATDAPAWVVEMDR